MSDKDIIEASGYAYIKERDKFKDVLKPKIYSSAFDLSVKVGIDYGNGKDVTASIIGFTNSKGQFIVLANFDDTTKIGKMIIDELDKMRTKSVDDLKDLKTLEIIKEKRVNVGTFIHLTKILKKDYEQCKALNNTFGANICDCDCEFLTEEEYETIKEMLE